MFQQLAPDAGQVRSLARGLPLEPPLQCIRLVALLFNANRSTLISMHHDLVRPLQLLLQITLCLTSPTTWPAASHVDTFRRDQGERVES